MRKILKCSWWDFVALIGVAGVTYGTFGYIEYAGIWKSLVMVPLLFALGFFAVEILYPIWFGQK